MSESKSENSNRIGSEPDERALIEAKIAAFFFGRLNFEKKSNVRYNDQNFRLQPLLRLLSLLGNPHADYRVIHIAGTKGKGSVATMIQHILTAAGIRCGLYTSPHIDHLAERFAIDGNQVSLEMIQRAMDAMQTAVAEVDRQSDADADFGQLTFFDLCTAAALLMFRQQQVKAAVIEVGLGGRLDSTNVVSPELCVITSISFDHMAQLGNTLAAIAGEKAGIIKPGIPVVSGVTGAEARAVIQGRAAALRCPMLQLGRDLFWCGQDSFQSPVTVALRLPETLPTGSATGPATSVQHVVHDLSLAMLGRHQRDNAALAVAAVLQLRQQAWEIPDSAIKQGLAQARVRGRIQPVRTDAGQTHVFVDAAHNPASFAALLESLHYLQTERVNQGQTAGQRTLVFAVSKDKDYENLLRQAAVFFDRIVLTQFHHNPRAASVDQLKAVLQRVTEQLRPSTPIEIWCQRQPEAAFQAALARSGPHDTVVVAGSVFLLAELGSLPVA